MTLAELSSGPVSDSLGQGASLLQMSLPPGTCVPGLSYTFQLAVGYTTVSGSGSASSQVATTTVTIIINAPPSGGALVVTPSSGTALDTAFLFSTTSWSDDPADYPLGYLFAYYAARPDLEIVVKTSGQISYSSAVLGAGQTGSGAVTCLVNASDSYGATQMATYSDVKVLPQTNRSALASAATALLSRALTQLDGSAVSQVLSALASSLNAVNCTVATPCTALSRSACSGTAHTCGPCLPGHLGVSGDSNARCAVVPPSLFPSTAGRISAWAERHLDLDTAEQDPRGRALAAGPIVTLLPAGATCVLGSTTAICISGNCTTDVALPASGAVGAAAAAASRSICGAAYKSCPNACSGSSRGTCVFRDANGLPASACLAQDAFCLPACECLQGFYGADCSMTATEIASSRALRDSMCAHLASLVYLQDTNPDVIFSRASMVSQTLVDVDQVSPQGLQACATLLTQTIANHTALVGQERAATLYLQALSRILAKGTAYPSSEAIFAQVSSTLTLTPKPYSNHNSSPKHNPNPNHYPNHYPNHNRTITVTITITITLTFAQVSQAVSDLLHGCQENLAVGEKPLVVTTDNIRVLTAVARPYSLQSARYSIPRTDFEAFSDTAAPLVTLDGSALPPSTYAVGLAVLQYTSNPLQIVLNSTVVRVETRQYAANAETFSGRSLVSFPASPVGFTATVVNHRPVTYGGIFGNTPTVQCHRALAPYTVSGQCSDGSVYTVTCTGYKGYFNLTCPSHVDVPECRMWNGVGFSSNPQCRAVRYNSGDTTCLCVGSVGSGAGERGLKLGGGLGLGKTDLDRDFYSSSSSTSAGNSNASAMASGFTTFTQMRSLLASYTATSAVRDIAASMVVSSTSFVQIYVAAPDIILVDYNFYQVQVTAAVIGVCLVLLLGMASWDQRELVTSRKHAIRDSSRPRTPGVFFSKLFPSEFAAGRWYRLLWNRMLVEHSYVCLCAPFKADRDYRTLKMIITFGHLLTFLFLHTALAWVLYSDNGSCENILDARKCATASTLLNLRTSCAYNPENESCSFLAPAHDASQVTPNPNFNPNRNP